MESPPRPNVERASEGLPYSYRYPGLFLAALSLVAIIVDIPIGFTTLVDSYRVASSGKLLLGGLIAVSVFVFVGAHACVLLGSLQMARGIPSRWSWPASWIACIPVVTPGVILGVPLGIWCLFTIRRTIR